MSWLDKIKRFQVRVVNLVGENKEDKSFCKSCGLIAGYHKWDCHFVVDKPTVSVPEINKVYEQYRHLDQLFSDIAWLKNDDEQGISPMRKALYDMWDAIEKDVLINRKLKGQA